MRLANASLVAAAAIAAAAYFILTPSDGDQEDIPDSFQQQEDHSNGGAQVESGVNAEERIEDLPDVDVASQAGAAEGDWWEDEEVLAKFLAEFDRQADAAVKASIAHRARLSEVMEGEQAELEKLIPGVRSGMVFGEFEGHEFGNLEVDMLMDARSSLASQLREYSIWAQEGAKIEKLPPMYELVRAAESYPPEFILAKMTGEHRTDYSPDVIRAVSLVRNSMLRETALLRGMEWELSPALQYAGDELGLDMSRFPARELVPRMRELKEYRDREVSRYVAQLEVIVGGL